MTLRWVWPYVAASLLAPLPATAQNPPGKYELTPFAAYRGGGTFEDKDSSAEFELRESNAWGLIINGAVKTNTQWEVLYSSQSTSVRPLATIPDEPAVDLDVEYLHIGGTYLFDGDRVQPFIAATFGASRFSPEPTGLGSKTLFSGSFGGGWKISLAKNLALRIEARVYGTLVDDDNRLFCESSGSENSCLLILEGSLFTQWETRAGLTFRF